MRRAVEKIGRAGTALTSAVLILSGCGGEGPETSSTSNSGPPRVGDTIPIHRTVDGERVPWFAAATLAGDDTVSVEDLRGSPVLLNLWATWCPPCRHETPYLQTIADRYGDRLRVVGVTVDDRGSKDAVRRFLGEAGATYTQLHDPTMGAMDIFGALGLPATFLIDPDGLVTFHRLGPVLEGDRAFELAVEELVGTADRSPQP